MFSKEMSRNFRLILEFALLASIWWFWGRLLLLAQTTADPKSDRTASADSEISPLNLRYDEPKTYPVGTKQTAIIGDFKCGSDGTVFLPVLENPATLNDRAKAGGLPVDRSQHFLITALTPSGDVLHFVHTDIPGLRNFFPELRYFVSSSEVFTLEAAEAYDPADPEKSLGLAHLILRYDYKGRYKGVVRLEPGLNPVTIAAFPSGDILVVSLNKLNQTTRLLLFDQTGRFLKEMSLFDQDYGKKLQSGNNQDGSESLNNSIWSHLAVAHWAAFGDDVLMAPNRAALPVIEINESGIVRATELKLSNGKTVGGVLSSNDQIYHVVVYQPNQSQPPADPSSEHKVYYKPTEIDDVLPSGGMLLKRITFAPSLTPVCASNDVITFISPREDDGKLQLIRGSILH